MQKFLGGKVRHFGVDKRKDMCKQVVREVNYARVRAESNISDICYFVFYQPTFQFQFIYHHSFLQSNQNEHLMTKLLATAGTILVEASPWDTLWGMIYDAKHTRAV